MSSSSEGVPTRRWTHMAGGVAVGALCAVGISMRMHNAVQYRTRMGFDAVENVAYVKMLLGSWALPAPDAAWATSHPPLFYYLSALIGRGLGVFESTPMLVWLIPLLSSLVGCTTAWAAYRLCLGSGPRDTTRAWLAAGLVLLLPVHIYTSAMFNEEILSSAIASIAVLAACTVSGQLGHGAGERVSPTVLSAIGVLVGFALLTKLSGLLVLAAIASAWLVAAVRKGEVRAYIAPIGIVVAGAAVVGGWFYARNLAVYGYIYPQDLAVHQVMFDMPPGARGVLDYLYFPLSTFRDPQLLNPDLLRSVWASTYASFWFDGHRHFLPHTPAASRAGSALLLLALVPTAAFFRGVIAGVGRLRRDPDEIDGVLLCLLAFTGLGYIAFTWGNPWFATLKGSYLLVAILPFAYYASDGLIAWTRAGRVRGGLVWGTLAVLAIVVISTFTIGLLFTKLDETGLPWRSIAS